MKLIDIVNKDRRIEVDKIESKNLYCITVDDNMTQKDLSADAVIRWLGNAMHEEG